MEATTMMADLTLSEELQDVDLGDKRRNERFVKIAGRLAAQPDKSVPDAMENHAEVEAYYRLMSNDAAEHQTLLEPHFEKTSRRSEASQTVLVAHDTTEFAYAIHDEPSRENLARLRANQQGFHWHASLAVSADGTRAPLGLVASRPYVHASQIEGQEALDFWRAQNGFLDNEQTRWLDAVEASEARLEDVDEVIHVMDREGDDFNTLFPMVFSGYGFVVRMTGDRNVSTGPKRSEKAPLEAVLDEVEWSKSIRTVELSARPKRKASKSHRARRFRSARLKIRATRVELRRPDNLPAANSPARFGVNVVEVSEIRAPKGEDPVRWLLVTDRPIDTDEDCWQVVDWYRARWQIEEYFKALKTGAAYSKLQHRSAHTLLAALSVKAMVAWNLLVIRYLGRNHEDVEASGWITPAQLAILRMKRPKIMKRKATAGRIMAAVASLGGHIKNNGPAGWQVLGRGWAQLLELEQGFLIARQMMEEM